MDSGLIATIILSRKKKPTRWNTSKAFDHVGVLVNEPPATRGLPFV